jgi:hypothetical protein
VRRGANRQTGRRGRLPMLPDSRRSWARRGAARAGPTRLPRGFHAAPTRLCSVGARPCPEARHRPIPHRRCGPARRLAAVRELGEVVPQDGRIRCSARRPPSISCGQGRSWATAPAPAQFVTRGRPDQLRPPIPPRTAHLRAPIELDARSGRGCRGATDPPGRHRSWSYDPGVMVWRGWVRHSVGHTGLARATGSMAADSTAGGSMATDSMAADSSRRGGNDVLHR